MIKAIIPELTKVITTTILVLTTPISPNNTIILRMIQNKQSKDIKKGNFYYKNHNKT